MIKTSFSLKQISRLSAQLRASLVNGVPLFQFSRAIAKPGFEINPESPFQIFNSFDYNIDEKGKHVQETEQLQEDTEALEKLSGPLSFEKALFTLKTLVKKAKISRIAPARLENVVNGITSNLQKMTMDDATLIVWGFSRLNYFPEVLIQPIEEIALKNIDAIESRDLAILLWGFAKMRIGSEEFWDSYSKKAEEFTSQMSIIDLVNTTWALTTKEIDREGLWKALEDHLGAYMKNLNDCQSISNLMISFAKMNKGDDKFWKKLENQFFLIMTHMEGQALANSIWALAKRNRLVSIKGNALETVILSKINKMKDLEVASIAWSFAKLYKGSTNFWTIMYNRLSRILKNDPKEITLATLCTCAWTLSNLKISEEADWKIIEKHLILKEDGIKLNHLHSLIASFATKSQGSHKLWEIFEGKLLEEISKLEPKTISGMLWAFASVDKGSEKFWRAMEETLLDNLSKLTNQGIALSLWAMTKAKRQNPEVLEKILEEIYTKFDQLNGTDLGMIMWSIGRLRLNSINVDMIISKMKQKLLEGIQLNIIDLAHFVFALNELEKGDEELWKSIENHLNQYMNEIEEEGWVIFLKAGCMNANFSETFWISAESEISANIKKYSGISIVNIMRSFFKKKTGSDKFWFMLEEEVKGKLEDLDGHLLGELASIISKKRIGENDFWERLEITVVDKLGKMRIKDKAKLIAAMGYENQGSLHLWSTMHENMKKVLTSERLNISELLDILAGFTHKRKGDHEFWNILEKRILDTMKLERNRTTKNIARIIKDFASIKRGSREFWTTMTGYLTASIERTPLKIAMNLVKSLDIIKEIDEEEKNLLTRHCIDRVLNAEESFAGYLTQLSFEPRICQKCTEEDVTKIKEKIQLRSQKTADIQQTEQLNQAFQKLQKARETIFVKE